MDMPPKRWCAASHRHVVALCAAAAALPCAGLGSESVLEDTRWRGYGREAFLGYLVSVGCEECAPLLHAERGPAEEAPFALSSQVFGCADVDVLLPSLHFLYEVARRRHDGALPGLLIDGGANVGRATARWIAALGDVFGRRLARNETQAPCIICAGADATAGGGATGAAAAPPTVAVVAVEPSESNFALLRRHAAEGGWEFEGYLGLKAALGSEAGEAMLAFNDDFAIDEIATLLFKPDDQRARQRVRVMTLGDVVREAHEKIPGLAGETPNIFLLKLDIEGMEPAVLRSIVKSEVPVKFVTFEYASNVWREGLANVVADLFAGGYFCFLITPERLFPVSGPFWDMVYELPMWSNLFCGREDDRDVADLVQLHVGAVGLWPVLPRTYLEGYAAGHDTPETLARARKLCTDLGDACAGVTCECPGGGCTPGALPPSLLRAADAAPTPALGACTARAGAGGARWSPSEEVTFLRDAEVGELFLLWRRHRAAEAAAAPRDAEGSQAL